MFRLAGVDLSLCAGDCSPEAAVDFLDEITTTTAPRYRRRDDDDGAAAGHHAATGRPDHVDHHDRTAGDHRATGDRRSSAHDASSGP